MREAKHLASELNALLSVYLSWRGHNIGHAHPTLEPKYGCVRSLVARCMDVD